MRALLGLAALALLVSGCGGGNDTKAPDAAPSSAAPSYVESDDCRTAGAQVLDNAQSLLDAEDLSQAQRYAAFMQGADIGYCTTAKNALYDLTAAAQGVVDKIEDCKLTSKWGLTDGGTDGMSCDRVVSAFTRLNQLIPPAQQALDAQR